MENADLDVSIETATCTSIGAGSLISPSASSSAATTGGQRECEAQSGESSNEAAGGLMLCQRLHERAPKKNESRDGSRMDPVNRVRAKVKRLSEEAGSD